MKISNKKSWFSMKKENGSAEINIFNDIGFFGITADDFVREYAALGPVDLTVRINSYGGEVFDGFAIYNRLKSHAQNVTVIIEGVAASITSIIAMAGKKIQIAKNAFIMIHDPSMFIGGTSTDLKHAAKLLDELKQKAVDIYREKSGLSDDELSNMMTEETWLDSKAAVEKGFADSEVGETENDEPATNRGIHLPEDMKNIFLSFTKLQTAKSPVMKGESSMKKCPHCGKEISVEGAFCAHCGKAISQAPAIDPAVHVARKREIEEARMQEQQRIKAISAACRKHNLPADFEESLVSSGEEYLTCAQKILDKLAEKLAPAASTPRTSVGLEDGEKFLAHAANCLAVATGIERDPARVADSKKDVRIGSIHSLARVVLDRAGVPHSHLDSVDLISKVLTMQGTGSSDLPAALENVANKSLQRGYDEAPTTFQQWCGRREVADFKTNSIVHVSGFGDLKDLPEGSPFEDAVIADKKETFSIDTKGRKFTITRQALVNDDLDVISRIPAAMGRAAARRVNQDVYDVLTSNTLVGPTLSDSVALFNLAAHYNLISTSGLVSVTSLAAAARKLREMPLITPEPGATTQYANLNMRYVLAGTSKEVAIRQVLGTGFDISQSIVGVLNPFASNAVIPVFDPYLQALLTAGGKDYAWYAIADQMDAETIGVAYLRGYTAPTLRRDASRVGESLGIVNDIYFDFGIYTADHRGIVYNDGATS